MTVWRMFAPYETAVSPYNLLNEVEANLFLFLYDNMTTFLTFLGRGEIDIKVW